MDAIIHNVDLILFNFLQFNTYSLFYFIENISMEYKRKTAAHTQTLIQTNTIYQSDEVTIAKRHKQKI